AQSGAVSVATSTESTVYVTDVVKTTVTTCPAGQTITSAGSTTVLTAPSVMTTSVTVKSTVSTTNVHTITVPVGGNNAVPSKTSTSLETTVYVTDVVKSTLTTCPAGQTVTASGKTTVLTAPSVMTTSVTVKSTVSATNVHTITVPAGGNNAVPSQTSTSLESTVYVTDVVKSTITTCPAGQTVTASGKTTVLTTPSVMTTSVTIKSTVSTVLTHTAIVPQSSPVSPEQTTPASVEGHVAIPSTVVLYSTKEVTITSCAPEVTNCPARSTQISTTVFPTAITVSSVWSRISSVPAASSPAASSPAGSVPAASSPAGSAPVVSSAAGSSPVSPETTSAPVTIPSTMFYYSTAVVTVTSCAEGVQNCPASSTVVMTSVVPTAYSVTSIISSSWTPIEYTSPAAGVPQESAPAVSAPAPIVPTSAPFGVSNSTMMSVGPKGTGAVGTGSGSKATSTYSPSQYTGAANKVGAAGLAGVAAFAAFLFASTWDTSLGPLNLSGQASYISDRITLESPGQDDSYLDFTANAIDQSINVNYPSPNVWYTLDTGFFSLYGGTAHVEYTSVNGSDVSLNTTLPLAYAQDAIPSIFYGLHIGSASTSGSVPGSLVLGGYDRSRCLTTPIVSNIDTFELADIGLGVASGDSPFPKDEQLPVRNLLQDSEVSSVKAYPNPGVPYLYLPRNTCAAVTEHLPVDFNETLGLYIWNTSAPSYQDIMTSPSYLSFNFNSGTSTSTIYLPFALLNLTLEWPLVNSPTQYFPCSPYQSPDGRFHLGRAFLQGAFMAQNWQTGQLMLAQAPGPDMADSSLVTISANGTSSVLPMIKAPSWNSTWASKLTAFQRNGSNSSEHTTGVGHKDLSSGTTAGVVIGVVVAIMLVAGVCWAWFRRQRRKAAEVHEEKVPPGLVEVCETGSVASSSLPTEVWAPGKHGLTLDPIELDAAHMNELHGISMEGGKGR
ncbi:hypothetical protein KCU60_g3447, partial [Aureobasidium melanogenum]